MRNTRKSSGKSATYASVVALMFAVGVLFAQDSPGNAQNMATHTSNDALNDPAPATVTVKGVEEPVYKVADVTTKPRQIKSQSPKFSEQARRDKVQGTVLLLLVVTQEGSVTDIRVKNGIGHGLDENAVKAVRKWKFEPATKDGKPVAVQLTVEVDFHLYDKET
jgi:TonB family protein